MVPVSMPRYTSFKRKQNGSISYFWTCPTAFRKAGAPYTSATLGHDLSQKELNEAAAVWNDRLDGWRKERSPFEEPDLTRYGTIEWLVNAYLKHDSFLERVAEFSRPDYRRVFDRVCETEIQRESTKQKVRVGDMKVSNMGVSTAEKVYHAFHRDGAARTSEKVVTYCKAMWKRMQPHHPTLFRPDTPNPWEGVTVKKRERAVKGHVDRETVYQFARGAIKEGRGELAAAAVLAFEWLMRPSSIGAGYAAWSGYRGPSDPDKIQIKHRKNGVSASHPLEFTEEDGTRVLLYQDAEEVLSQTPRYGTSIVCKKNGQLFGDGTYLAHEVREMGDKLGIEGFSLDKCRHGGMTELEEMGLTEGQGRVLSKHKTAKAYRGYAKETEKRVLEATKKRMGATSGKAVEEQSENAISEMAKDVFQKSAIAKSDRKG
ncbi:hypothetical protein [Sinorhizobium fredii]|uniref:Integrase n=1 Tax=Rhizobium fredii TaxID=380 RepID=A0A2L0H4G9_RHIFR|nr:hypothetical protein [Sinorhizobium fredii]AUX76363.1 hypothetical protein NXT3_CH01795 [Sinorhizobium fredii]